MQDMQYNVGNTNPKTHQKNHPTWSSRLHSIDIEMVQQMKICQCNLQNKQTKRKNPHDHLNICFENFEKKLWKNPTLLHDKGLRELRETGTYIHIIKVIYTKLKANIKLNNRRES